FDDLVDRIRLLLRHGILRRLDCARSRGARGDGNSIRGSNLRLDDGPSPTEGRECQRREAVCTHPESTLETAKKKDRARARMGGRIALPSIRQRLGPTTSLLEGDGPRARGRAKSAPGRGVVRGESATLLSLRSVSSSRRPRTRHGSGG